MTTSAIAEPFSTGLLRLRWSALAPVLVAGAYYIGAEAAFAIGTLTQQFAPFWPPNVVLFCALLWAPRRHWPIYIAAVFPAHLVAELGVAMPLPQLLAAFGCNVSVALLNACALRWLLREPPWLGSLRNASLYLVTAVILIPAAVALAAGFEPMLGDGDPKWYWQFWARWYLSNALANLTLAPIVLAVWGEGLRRPFGKPRWGRVIEASVIAAALIASCSAAFDTQLTRIVADFAPAMLYLPVPLLVAAAVRFGAKGAGAGILVVTVMVLFGAMHSHGPFAGVSPDHNVLSVQLFLAVIAIPTILLAAVVEELRRTNDRLSAMLNGISDCYYTLDRGGLITAANTIGAAWLGAPKPKDLVGRNFWEITRDRPQEQAWVQRAMETGIPAHGEVQSSNGRWVDVHAYPAAGGVSIFCHETTERRAAERDVRNTQVLLQSSLDALTAYIAILDSTGKIIATNSAWRQIAEALKGTGECYMLGTNYVEECERARPHQRMIAAGLRQLMRGEVEEFRLEYASDVLEGGWLQMRGTCFGAGADLRLVVAHVDISEIKASESALRRLTGQLMRSQDDERRRISRELHDSTAQNLLGAALGISQALRLVPRLKRTAKAALEESRALIDESQREIRTVSYLLHPPMLDVAGLPAALRWLCEGFGKRTEIAVELHTEPGIERLPAELEAALFRIAQEGLTNVHRHSGATKAEVSLSLAQRAGSAQHIELAIEDNGRGMPVASAGQSGLNRRSRGAQSMGVGLAGMRERLHQFGGKMEIDSGPQGTTVRVSAPLPVNQS
jgi:signal transduction histidine kinase/integral membrane sensor domain MASE1